MCLILWLLVSKILVFMTIPDLLEELEGDVNFLFDEQVIQNERLLTLEEDKDTIEEQLFTIYGQLDGE